MSRGTGWKEKLAHWQKYEYSGMKPGLSRIRAFLRETGDPQEKYRSVQIAGTNGKGSTAAMLSAALKASGLTTAAYTSPHLVRLNERIAVNGAPVPDADLERLVKRFAPLAERHGLTYFEFITAIAFHYFAEKKTEIAVLEAGLGGRFDATNVVARPELSIITGIGLDHQEILGRTLKKIAFEKAGIIKPHCPVISATTAPEARAVIRKAASKNRSELKEFGREYSCVEGETHWRGGYQKLSYRSGMGKKSVRLSLFGEHQARNCSNVLAALETLAQAGIQVRWPEALASLKDVHWPGRFDVRTVGKGNKKRTVILDGAHNPQGIRLFLSTLRRSIWGGKRGTLIFGVLGDKDYRSMVSLLAGAFRKIVLVPVRSERSAGTDVIGAQWARCGRTIELRSAGSFGEALKMTGGDRVTAVTGSLYLIGEALSELNERRG